MDIAIRLTDLGLFGNDAAEDEPEEVFRSYVLETPAIAQFVDADRSLCVVRAYKGEGKSALLRHAYLQITASTPAPALAISRTAIELSPDFTSDDYPVCVRQWKSAIFSLLASEIGATIGRAWTDDPMTLVEESERNGFRSRNFVGAVSDRLSSGLEIGPVKAKLPGRTANTPGQIAGAVRRIAKLGPLIWLFIDDLDKNFENTRSQRVRISAFFDAARDLVRAVPELRLRVAIRPNIWAALKLEFESLSHVEQYVHDLTWSEESCRDLLARRIEGWLKRHNQWPRIGQALPPPGASRSRALIATVFQDPIPWGATTRPPHVVLFTLSKHRPRWLIELSKTAAAAAERSGRNRIGLDDITVDMTSFGDRRIKDTIAEFRSQCGQIDELIAAFGRAPEQFLTGELLALIDRKILNHVDVRITGIPGRPSALQVAAFLFEIGFVYGRRDHGEGDYEHVTFSERPSLLRARSNVDDGLAWEVHPVFRQALEMRDAAGREMRRHAPAKKRRGPAG